MLVMCGEYDELMAGPGSKLPQGPREKLQALEIWQRYSRDIAEIWPRARSCRRSRDGRDAAEVRPRYGRGTVEIYPRSSRDLAEI
jgi:hypothetical protein